MKNYNMENEWKDLINEDIEEEVLIDEEKLIMNANADAMEQIVQDSIKKDTLPIVRY
jgi:hypothetical protein